MSANEPTKTEEDFKVTVTFQEEPIWASRILCLVAYLKGAERSPESRHLIRGLLECLADYLNEDEDMGFTIVIKDRVRRKK